MVGRASHLLLALVFALGALLPCALAADLQAGVASRASDAPILMILCPCGCDEAPPSGAIGTAWVGPPSVAPPLPVGLDRRFEARTRGPVHHALSRSLEHVPLPV